MLWHKLSTHKQNLFVISVAVLLSVIIIGITAVIAIAG